MAITCIATAKCFREGRRFYPGDTVVFDGDKKDLPKYLVPKGDYKSEAPKAVKENPDMFEGAGLAVKADSISEVSIGGKGKVPPVSHHALNLAEEYSVNIDDVHGTGTEGQVTKADVQKFIDANTGPNAEVI
jgi:pyruvate/2-oxoglutarate dehydrogenase complex dihydrolipoamide acyltransferase (E2) component